MEPIPLVERGRQIADAVASRVPGTIVVDEGWAWRILIKGRGYCLLRRDTTFVQVSSGTTTTILEGVATMEKFALIDRLVAIMEGLPPRTEPPLYPVVTPTMATVEPSLSPIPPAHDMDVVMPLSPPPPLPPKRGRKRKASELVSDVPVKKARTGIRLTEVQRLKAEAKVYKGYYRV